MSTSTVTILSWNIQNGLGTDGVRSLDRIASVINAMGAADVICLQEVSRGLPFEPGQDCPDQVAALAERFPGYDVVFGPAIDMVARETGERAQYGNLILSRLPVLSRFLHSLPQPAKAGRRQMPRQATEVTVAVNTGQDTLRITTTHLEFHSQGQRMAQLERLRSVHRQIDDSLREVPAFRKTGPYQYLPRAGKAVIAGDLNCLPHSAEMQLLTSSDVAAGAQLTDAWQALRGAQPHEPTCGIFDTKQWPQGAHCRDFFVISESLAGQCTDLVTNTETNASDHQPIRLTLSF